MPRRSGQAVAPRQLEVDPELSGETVTVTINGYTYRSTVAAYGDEFLLPLSAENRAAVVVAPPRVSLSTFSPIAAFTR